MHQPLRTAALALACAASLWPAGAGSAAAEPYFVGAVVSLTGPAATLGRPAADSMQMAVNEINAAGGIDGHPLALTVLDDGSNGTDAVAAARRLLDQHPVALIGSSGTPTSLAIIPIATEAGVPLISLGSSSQIVEPAADRRWIFKVPVADTYIAQRLQRSLKARGLLRVAVVYRDDDYGKSGVARFIETGKAFGISVIDQEAIAATATDATVQLTHVRAANPQAVVMWTTLPSATVLAKAYRELNLTYPLYYSEGSANPIFLAQAGSAADGVYFASEKAAVAAAIPAADPQKKILMHYAAEFARLYPKDGPPSIFGGFGYDGVQLLAEGLRRARAGGAKLRDALEHVSYVGISGPYHMTPADHNGLGIDAVELTEAEGGTFAVRR